MISVVMASYLGIYKHAAKDRDRKILRAVDSVLNQSVKCELVVVADGCNKTVDLLGRYEGKINGYLITKQPTWSGNVRNTGIEKAKGEIIIYLDVDDYLEKGHCEFIEKNFSGDWVWFDDKVFKGGWISRKCDINKRGLCGTSNLAHKKVKIWPVKGLYAHDFLAIENLKKWSSKYKYIGHGGYLVSHIPGRMDV